MLIGVGGCGKHSVARLAAFAAGCEVFEITLSRGYNETSFKEDLKLLFNSLITTPTIFLFSSAQVSVKLLRFIVPLFCCAMQQNKSHSEACALQCNAGKVTRHKSLD